MPLLLAALVSCGGEPPTVTGLEWRVESRPGSETIPARESLSVFLALRDSDGLEDIEAIWVLNDAEELYWRLDAATWTRRSEGGEEWFGAADLTMPDFAPVPPGPWRALVADLAGRRVERSWRIEAAPASPRSPPSLDREGGYLALRSAWPENLLLAYDAAGVLVRAAAVRPGRLEAGAAFGAADAARAVRIAAYGYDPASQRGAYAPRMGMR